MATDTIARALALQAGTKNTLQDERLTELDKKLFIGSYEDLPDQGSEGVLYIAADRHTAYTWDPDKQQYVPCDPGGAAAYGELKDLPTLNGVTILGDKTAADYGICNWNRIGDKG